MSCVLSSVPGPGGVSVSEEHGYASSPAFSRARNSFKDAENCTVSSLTVAKRARLDRVRDELALTKAAVRGVVHQHSSGIWGARVEQPKSGTPATASSARPTSTSRISSPAGWDKGCSERTGCRGLWSGSSAERPLAAPETRVPRNASRPTHVVRRTHVARFDQAPRSAERGAFDPRQRPVPPPAPSWRLPARRGHLRSAGAGSCPRDVGDDRVEIARR